MQLLACILKALKPAAIIPRLYLDHEWIPNCVSGQSRNVPIPSKVETSPGRHSKGSHSLLSRESGFRLRRVLRAPKGSLDGFRRKLHNARERGWERSLKSRGTFLLCRDRAKITVSRLQCQDYSVNRDYSADYSAIHLVREDYCCEDYTNSLPGSFHDRLPNVQRGSKSTMGGGITRQLLPKPEERETVV